MNLQATPEGRGESRLAPVFAFNKAIRFVCIVDQEGNAIASLGRPGLISLEPEERTADVFARAAIAWGMSEGMNEYHGKVRTAIVIREKVTIVCFLGIGKMYLVFADPEFSISETERLGRVLDRLSVG